MSSAKMHMPRKKVMAFPIGAYYIFAMTKEELRAWRDRNFGSAPGANKAAAEAIGLTLRAFTMRLYGSQEISKTVALACAAIDKGLSA